MPKNLYFLGHYWNVDVVPIDELPYDSLCISDWSKLSIKIVDTLAPPVFEEVLIHEVIELSILNARIVENIKDSRRILGDDADYIAECLDSVVQDVLRSNPDWFPITRGVHAVRTQNRSRMPKSSLDSGGTPSSAR